MNQNIKNMILFCAGFLLIAKAGFCDPEMVDIELALPKGNSYVVETTELHSATPKGPTTRTFKKKISYEVIDAIPNSDMSLKVTTRSVFFDSTEEPHHDHLLYDSEKSTAPPALISNEAAAIGQPLTILITPEGFVKKAIGLEAIEKKTHELIEKAPEEIQAMKNFLQNDLGVKTKLHYLQTIYRYKLFNIYPKHPVTIGSSWSKKYYFDPYQYEQTMTLKDRKEGITYLEEKTSGTRNDGKGRFTQKGILEVEEKTGWIRKKDLQMEHFALDKDGKEVLMSTGELHLTSTAEPKEKA